MASLDDDTDRSGMVNVFYWHGSGLVRIGSKLSHYPRHVPMPDIKPVHTLAERYDGMIDAHISIIGGLLNFTTGNDSLLANVSADIEDRLRTGPDSKIGLVY